MRKVSRENGTNYLELYAREPGTVKLLVTDKEGTTVEVEVIVEGDIEEDVVDEEKTGIRYIRDWVNGSNRNGYTHWIEIEAIEKGTNENIAYGKNITGKYDSKTGLGYSNIVDNNKETYGEGIETGENYVLIDLGQKYDIEKVNILHYFKDYRTYNGTKTEVSSDGINWTVLFDSAGSGVYEEPLDGSGKSYDVENIVENIDLVSNTISNIEILLSQYNYGGLSLASTETENGKQDAIINGKINEDLIIKLNKILENIILNVNDEEDILKRIRYYTKINIELRGIKKGNERYDSFIDYLIYSLEEEIELLYKIDNPFNKLLLAEFNIYSSELVSKINEAALIKDFNKEILKEKFGGTLTKSSLGYLVNINVLTQDELNTFNQLKPSVDDIYKQLLLLEEFRIYHESFNKGSNEAIKDYILEYLELIDPTEIPQLILGIYNIIGKVVTGDYNIDEILEKGEEFYEIVQNLEEILAGLEEEKKEYYKGYIYTTVSLMFIPIKIDKFNKLKKIDSGDSKIITEVKERRKQVNNHLLSTFLKKQRKISNKGRPRYDNGISGKDRKIFEWDASHGGEVEVYNYKGKHIGVYDPDGNLIKEAVDGRTIDL